MNWTEKEKQAAIEACEQWRGTPHVHRRMIPGKGVDCVHFVVAVLVAAGIVEPVKRLPSYPLTWGLASPENVLSKAFLLTCPVKRIPLDQVGGYKFGDVVIFKAGRQSNHAGIVIDGKLWHVMTGGEVHGTLLAPHVCKIQDVIRFTGRGWKKAPSEIDLLSLS